MDSGSFIWLWLLIAPLVLAGLSLIGVGDSSHHHDRNRTLGTDPSRL